MSSRPSRWWILAGAALGSVLAHRRGVPWFVGAILVAPLTVAVVDLVYWARSVVRRSRARPPCVACGARVIDAPYRVRCACGRTYATTSDGEVQLIELSPRGLVASRTRRSRAGVWRPWKPSLEELSPEHRARVAEWLESARTTAEMPPMERVCRPNWKRFLYPAFMAVLFAAPWLLIALGRNATTCPGGTGPLPPRFYGFQAFLIAVGIIASLPSLMSRIDARGVRGWRGVGTLTIPWSEIAFVLPAFGYVHVTARNGDRVTIATSHFAEPDWIAPLIARNAPSDVDVS